MNLDRVTAFAVRWACLYTRGVRRPVARRRIEEIQGDLHDQISHERSLAISDRRIAVRIASRTIRGAAADLAWRAHEARTARTTKEHPVDAVGFAKAMARVGAFVLAFLSVPLIGMAVSDEVAWSITDFVLAAIALSIIGSCADAAIRRRGNVWIAATVAVLGVVAGALGESGDAPGLVLIGAMMIAGGGAMAHRRSVVAGRR